MTFPQVRNAFSSHHTFQQNLDKFIYFSPLTTGVTGSAIKISKELFLPFFCAVDPNTLDGQDVIRQIETLRSMPQVSKPQLYRDRNNHQLKVNALAGTFESLLVVKNLHVFYRKSQEPGDKTPTIYITNVRVKSEAQDQKTGLYEWQRGAWGGGKVVRATKPALDGKSVYINGAEPNIASAYEHAECATNDAKVTLFYVPLDVSDDVGMWRSTKRSHATEYAVEELTAIVRKNQKVLRGISWYVEGEGTAVLAEAINRISGELVNHQFRFINPIGNTSALIDKLSGKKARLEGEFFNYNHNTASLLSLSAQADQMLAAIGKLPAGKNYDKITRGYITQAIDALGKVGARVVSQQDKLKTTKQTFVQALKQAGIYR